MIYYKPPLNEYVETSATTFLNAQIRYIFFLSNSTGKSLVYQHCLKLVMWFKVADQKFIGKKIVQNGNLCILVSDLKHVWSKYLSDNELLLISQVVYYFFLFLMLKYFIWIRYEFDMIVNYSTKNSNILIKLLHVYSVI